MLQKLQLKVQMLTCPLKLLKREARKCSAIEIREKNKPKEGAPKGTLKKPAASSQASKDKPAEPKTTSTIVFKKKMLLKLGRLRCRGNRNGCAKCRNETFQGLRFNRELWKAQQKLHKHK